MISGMKPPDLRNEASDSVLAKPSSVGAFKVHDRKNDGNSWQSQRIPQNRGRPEKESLRLLSLQAGRGIACLMVVLHHAASYASDPRYWNLPGILPALRGTQLGVEYFFVLSGVVIYLAHEKDIQNPSRFGQYVVKRFRRIYPMYWLVLIPLVAQYLLRPHVGADYQRNEWVIASGIALVHVRSLEVNLPVAWSLFHEVLFYGFFALLIWKRRSGSVALVLWLAASVYFLVWHGNQYLSSYLFSPLHLLFGMGMLAAWILRHKTVPFPGFAAMVGLGMFGSSIVLAMGNDFPVWVSILSGAGATFVILGTSALERKGRIWIPEFLVFLGGASYSIYLLHYPFLMFAMPAIYRVSVRFHATVWMAMAVIVVLGTAAGCAFHMWVERPMLKRLETINLSAVLPTGATAIFSYLRRIAEIGLLPGFGRASSQPRRDDGM